MRKVCVCKSGGFVSLQQLLVTQKDVSCESCAALLSHFGFNADLLADAIQKGLAGEDVFATLPDQQGSEDKKDPIEDGEEREAEQDDDPFDEVKKHQGVVELLPPGTMGKRFPFRCLLCRSGTQPHGRVAELHAAKSKSVKYFLHKHLNSATHRQNVIKLQGESKDNYVPCEGMMVNDRLSAGLLFEYRREFETCVSMSNLKMFAKHIYWQEPNAGGWFIRHQKCLKQCPAMPSSIRSMCQDRVAFCSGYIQGSRQPCPYFYPVRTSILSVLLCTSSFF